MTDRRGAHLLEAAVGVVAGGGLEALSVRAVAAAAGVSAAQVQYYFRTKDELLSAAFEHVSDGFLARAATVDESRPTGAVLRELLRLWLPLDAASERSARVWLAFTAAAATSPVLGAANAALDADLRTALATLLDEADAAGELVAGLDLPVEAGVLLAVVDGLVLQALAVPAAEREALAGAGLDAHLSRLLRHPVRHPTRRPARRPARRRPAPGATHDPRSPR